MCHLFAHASASAHLFAHEGETADATLGHLGTNSDATHGFLGTKSDATLDLLGTNSDATGEKGGLRAQLGMALDYNVPNTPRTLTPNPQPLDRIP